MKRAVFYFAAFLALVAICRPAVAQQLIPNGDFETIALDENDMPILDDYNNMVPIEWARSNTGDPPPDGTPKTELVVGDSSGSGSHSAALNPPPGGAWSPPQDPHSDWRSASFPTTPGETLQFSIDVKFLDVVNFPDFQQIRVDLRSFEDEQGTTFAGESLLFVSPVGYRFSDIDPNTPDDPVEADFTDEGWHTLAFDWLVPAVANGQNIDGNFSDVRISINAFSTLTEGQVRIDNVSALRPLAGDYNGNGSIDAADYTIWRDTYGSTTDLRANGDDTGASMGVIDDADYVVWKSSFAGPAAGTTQAIPEPHALALVAMLAALFAPCRWRSR